MLNLEKLNLRVLVADDSAVLRRFVREALSGASSHIFVEETDNGADCLRHLSAFNYDLSFIDVNMPSLSGMEALAEARELGSETFVVIMSGELTEERCELARALKAYDYLLKPFKAEDIAGILQSYYRVKTASRVLVVDDSSTVRKIVEKVLEGSIFDFEVDEVGNGASALVAYQARRHDIVFLDINMPGIDGFETLELLRKTNPEVRVVFMTGDRTAGLSDAAKVLGVQAFLHKPFFPEQINSVLHDLYGLRPPHLAAQDKDVIAI